MTRFAPVLDVPAGPSSLIKGVHTTSGSSSEISDLELANMCAINIPDKATHLQVCYKSFCLILQNRSLKKLVTSNMKLQDRKNRAITSLPLNLIFKPSGVELNVSFYQTILSQ